ncbi:Uma2 family endonuclease [Kineosphaera limosa]|uniref:Putative restriction endonuclease domain-containing protein n=1 Tax=Kineosphaera limosa NBRC 100340 TaxID=1184609 RepID=K6WB09_9MICO|nr:Uma2 family endonuclease [Kineosphaera limosa]NYE00798.1 Uma2 family endonuclease [Kineosphaera limosa]GAB96410.1 hypothetical protein KILIM_037_00290 [Kineosphaera limosa NBRC 100340]
MTTTIHDDRVWTRSERDALPDERHRYELLDGALIVSAAPRPIHQIVVFGLYNQLWPACPEHLRILGAPLDIDLSEDSVLEPDLLVARRDQFDDRGLPGRPELAVEVLSPSSRRIDRVLKRERYERAGTPAYWIVDPDELTLTAYELRDARFELAAQVGPQDGWTASVPFEVTLTPGRWAD